ncbi:MAG: hypothetical protein ACYSW6_10845 [Planctomycetota bacterium]|jgi:hypothetical protein
MVKYIRAGSLEAVDCTEYQEFEEVDTGADEFGPYWSARVKREGKRYIVGNYYDLESVADVDQVQAVQVSE